MEAPRCRRIVESAVETTNASSATINDATDASTRTQARVAFSLDSFIMCFFTPDKDSCEYMRVFSKIIIREVLKTNRLRSDGSPWWGALHDNLLEALLETPGRFEAGQEPCSPIRSRKTTPE